MKNRILVWSLSGHLTERVNQAEDGKCMGELDGDFAGEATFNDHGGVNQIGGDDSVGKQQEKEPTAKKVPTHTRTTNWVRKRR